MKQTVTISSSRDLQRFKRDFVKLIDIVRNADGSYVLHVDVKCRSAASPSIISKADFDRVVNPPQDGQITREQLRAEYEKRPLRKVLNRKDFTSYYYSDI
jgi:hypothetical protein